jgi:thiamine kinase-like enzyme
MPPAPAVAAARLRELAALEAALPGYADTTAVIHCDLRVDNVIIDGSGAAWLVDWNWPCHGPAWWDTAGLLITAYASGLDADALFAAHPTTADAPTDALDCALATLAGYLLSRAAAAPTDASWHARDHQRWSGTQALAWLAARRDW